MRESTAIIAARLGPPLCVGLILGLTGPYGTFDLLGTGPRLVYWLAVVSLNWLVADAVLRRVDVVTGGRLPLPRLLVPLIGALAAAPPATGIVTLANGLSGIGWPEDVLRLFGQVLLLLVAICLPVYTWEEMREKATDQREPHARDMPRSPFVMDPPPEHGGLSLFTARLPGPLGGRLLCLEMQDHYLVVHHSGGSEMILCRMEDAVRELAGLGMRVHRSWWVAADAVADTEREGQRTFLKLSDQRRVPVSRSFRPDLKAAGWL